MKRELLCLACDKKMQAIECEVANEEDFTTPPEAYKRIYGWVTEEVYLCDLCGKSIKKGERCVLKKTFILDYPPRAGRYRTEKE